MQSASTLAQLAKLLMADGRFVSEFGATSSAQNRRIRIHNYAKDKCYGSEADKIADRESMRLLIEDRLSLDSPETSNVASYTLHEMIAAYRDNSATPTSSTGSLNSKDNTMNAITKTQAIEVTIQVNINGVNAASYSDAQLYAMIQTQEGEIGALNGLQNKPQSLLAEIAKRQKGIDTLVQYLNDRDAAKNPAPVAAAPATVGQATDQLARPGTLA